MHASFENGVLENGILQSSIDLNTGNIVELVLKGKTENLVDVKAEKGLNEYLFLEGKDVSTIQHSGPIQIHVEERGPLVVTLRIESSAPGCNSLIRKVKLTAGADCLELFNIVDKKRARNESSPGPGKSG